MAAKTYITMFEVGGKLQTSFHSSFESAGKQFKILESKSAHAAKKIHYSFEKLGHSIEKAFAPLHKLAHFTGIGAILGGAITAFEGARLLEGGFEIHAEREVLQNQMRAVLASKHGEGQLGEIDSMVRRFSDNEAPIKYEPAMEAINRLLSTNMDKFKTPEALHTILGNIADLSKDENSFEHVMDAYVKMQSMHKVDRQHLQQMDLRSGFSVSSEMAKSAGMKPEEFTSAIFKHQISQDKLLIAIAQLTGEGGPAYQYPKEQMKGLKGIFVRMEERFWDFNDSIGNLEEAFISPLAESFLEFVGPEQLKHLFDPILPQVKQIGNSLRMSFNFLEDTDRFEKTGRRLEEIFGVFIGQGSKGDPWDFVATATAVWDKFNATLRKIENSLIWVRDNFGEVEKRAKMALGVWVDSEVIAVVANIATITTTLWEATAAAWGLIAPLLANPITWIVAGVVALGVAVWWVATHWEDVKKYAVMAWDGITEKWGQFSSWLAGVFKPVTDFFAPLFEQIGKMFGKLQAIGSDLAPIFEDIFGWTKEFAWERLKETWGVLKPVFEAIGDVFEKWIMPSLKWLAGSWVDSLTKGFEALNLALNGVKTAAGGIKYLWDRIFHGGDSTKGNLGKTEPFVPITDKERVEKLQFGEYTLGGIFSAPHFGLVAEAGPEAIIPLNRSHRSLKLLESAADAMGLGSGLGSSGPSGNTSFHIPVSITINGNADTETVREAGARVAQSIRDEVLAMFEGHRGTRLA